MSPVAQPVGDASDQKASGGEHAPVARHGVTGRLRGKTAASGQKLVDPQPHREFNPAVEEHHQRAEPEAEAEPDRSLRERRFLLIPAFRIAPESERQREQQRQAELNGADRHISPAPASSGGENERDQPRSTARPEPPAAVQPAHVPAGVVAGDVVVHPGIDRSLTESEWNCEEQQTPERGRKGVSEQGTTGNEAADHQQSSGPGPAQNLAAEKRRYRRADRQQRREKSRVIDGSPQFPAHRIPGNAKHGVRQPETDESDVDDDEQNQMPPTGRHRRKKRFHDYFSILFIRRQGLPTEVPAVPINKGTPPPKKSNPRFSPKSENHCKTAPSHIPSLRMRFNG